MSVHVFPILNPLTLPSPYHLSGSSQFTSPKHPVSCIEPGLATCFVYDIIHISMPFSQIIPPSPTESRRLFYTSVSLLLSRIQGYRRRQWPDSSTLAWQIPWTEEPGRLQSMGSLGVGHDWATEQQQNDGSKVNPGSNVSGLTLGGGNWSLLYRVK